MKSVVMAGGVGLFAAVLFTACSDSSRSLNPTAPSAVVADSQASVVGDGAVSGAMGKPANPGNGNGKGNGNGNGNENPGAGKPENPGNGKPGNPGNGKPEEPGNPHVPDAPSVSQPPVPSGNTSPGNTTPGNTVPRAPGRSKAEIEGLIGAIAGSTITVSGQVISVPEAAVIRHGSHAFTFADLAIGDRVHVRATRVTVDDSVSLEATEVKLQDRAGDEDDPDDSDDDDPVEPTLLVSVGALDADAAEAGLDPGVFRFSRAGDTTAALTVTIAITGTATGGSDYTSLPLTVTFEAGEATADVSVVPLADATAEGSETVIVTIADGDDYEVGSPATATVTIAG